jgi:glycosyltransferase involved in cell wall biosynthesis
VQKIVLITSGQPSLNPRLVKEADALADSGYFVTVLYQYWNDWGTQLDVELLKNKKWQAIRVGGSPNIEKAIYWLSRLNFKLFNFLADKIGYKFNIAERAIGRCTKQLQKKASSIKADLYIAHNLGALPAVVLASKKNKAKCGFDAEDFHRNEVADDTESKSYRITKFIEDKYLPSIDYLTTASPLICKAYQELYLNFNPVVINNVFSNQFLHEVNYSTPSKALKLFWFSQTIGKLRGLEDVIQALNKLNNPLIELHLLGKLSDENLAYFNQLSISKLNFHQPIIADEIFKLANQFDIGLALEPGFCINNNIALSNKLFTYLTAGLVVIASETLAQKAFIEENPEIGKSYPIGDIDTLASIINNYNENRDLLNQTKTNALGLAKTKYNWELESEKFMDIVKSQF